MKKTNDLVERAAQNQNILGAVTGDIIGSVYEWNRIKTKDFPLFHKGCEFTDDSVLTFAVADALLNDKDYSLKVWEYSRRYPSAGYGGNFKKWMVDHERQAYNSFGNGSAMRVSAVGFLCHNLEDVLREAKASAVITHNHPEGIKGAQATAAAIFLARNGNSKVEIKDMLQNTFEYDLNFSLDEIRPSYRFNEICQDTVPQAIVAFLESSDYEDAIRNAISLGGDSDTLACITGGIAAAYYGGIPEEIRIYACGLLTEEFLELLIQTESF